MGRGWGPPITATSRASSWGSIAASTASRSISRQPEGIELCLRLSRRWTCLLENFRPGTMERLGLGLRSGRRPQSAADLLLDLRLRSGRPPRDEPAMDLIVQSSSGLMSITGTEDGGPVRCGYSVADVSAGMFAIMGILMALRSRDKTGRGQYIDVSMFDSMISGMSRCFMIYLGSNTLPKPMGSAYPTIVPYRVFSGKDRDFSIAIGSEKLWTAFCRGPPASRSRAPSRLRHEPPAGEKPPRDRRPALRLVSHASRRRMAGHPRHGHPLLARPQPPRSRGIPQSDFRAMFPTVQNSPVGPHRVTARRSSSPAAPKPPAPPSHHARPQCSANIPARRWPICWGSTPRRSASSSRAASYFRRKSRLARTQFECTSTRACGKRKTRPAKARSRFAELFAALRYSRLLLATFAATRVGRAFGPLRASRRRTANRISARLRLRRLRLSLGSGVAILPPGSRHRAVRRSSACCCGRRDRTSARAAESSDRAARRCRGCAAGRGRDHGRSRA